MGAVKELRGNGLALIIFCAVEMLGGINYEEAK